MLKDTVEEVLDCLDTAGKHQPENANIFMNVLLALVFYIKQWFGDEKVNVEKTESREEKQNSKEYWNEYVKNLTIAETLEVDENLEDETDAEDEEAEVPSA